MDEEMPIETQMWWMIVNHMDDIKLATVGATADAICKDLIEWHNKNLGRKLVWK